jgi:prepilin-type N-terminal cleavage/methylation domain-containing protein
MISAADRGRGQPDGGFTLIELLVVISIMSVIVALAPVLSSGVSGARFRAAVASIVGTLRAMHVQAERSGRPVTVVVEPYSFIWQSRVSGWPRGVDRIALSAEASSPDRNATIAFFPDGSATGARLDVSGGGHRAVIWIDWAGGYVHADP